MKYRRKPVVVDAVQWFKHGDYFGVRKYVGQEEDESFKYKVCDSCDNRYWAHGKVRLVPGLTNWTKVCPGDWILKYEDGHLETLTDQEFKNEFEIEPDERLAK